MTPLHNPRCELELRVAEHGQCGESCQVDDSGFVAESVPYWFRQREVSESSVTVENSSTSRRPYHSESLRAVHCPVVRERSSGTSIVGV